MVTRIGWVVTVVAGLLAACLGGCAKQTGEPKAVTNPAGSAARPAVTNPAAPGVTNPAAAAAGAAELRVVKSFPTTSPDRGWDYVTVDPLGRRVYVARSTRVLVFDADSGAEVGQVANVQGSHGIAIVRDVNKGFATAGTASAVVVFDLKTLKTVATVPAGKRPDAILYDPASKKVFAFNHAGGDVTIIDPAAVDKAPATLPVGGTGKALEFGATDGAGKVYVNLEDASEVVAIDSLAKPAKVIARWPIAPGAEPTGLAIDPAHRRLFVGCGNKTMVILDADSGKVLGSVPVGAGVDGAAFDPQLGLAMTANGKDGTLTAVREDPAGKFNVVQTLKTAVGAKTIAVDPKTHQVYLPSFVTGPDGKQVFGLLVLGGAEKR